MQNMETDEAVRTEIFKQITPTTNKNFKIEKTCKQEISSATKSTDLTEQKKRIQKINPSYKIRATSKKIKKLSSKNIPSEISEQSNTGRRPESNYEQQQLFPKTCSEPFEESLTKDEKSKYNEIDFIESDQEFKASALQKNVLGRIASVEDQSTDFTAKKLSEFISQGSENELTTKRHSLIYRRSKKKRTKGKLLRNLKKKEEYDEDKFLEDTNDFQVCDGGKAKTIESSLDSNSMASEINMDDMFIGKDLIDWKAETNVFKSNLIIPEEDENPIINIDLDSHAEPIDYFLLIIDRKIITDAVVATNIYYKNKPPHKQKLKIHAKAWVDVQDYEMGRFFGLLYLMGILKKTVLRDYWSTDPLLETPSFRSTMTRDRFSEIAAHFRLYEESRMDRREPLYKIRHFIDRIIENSRRYYSPSRNLSLDESMISYKGRNRFKMYMPHKPTRFGFKAYVVADSCSGFALSWEMHSYTKDNPFSLKDTIMRLLAPYRNGGFTVYMDRFYTSPELLAELEQRGIRGCGTILPARLCLSDSIKKDLNTLTHLESKHFKTEDQRFVVMRDGAKFVYLLSTFHQNYVVEAMRTLRKREKKRDPVAAASGAIKRKVITPQMIVDYNKYMGGVDRLDQCISTYCYAPRTLKWQMRVFYYFLDIAMFNSYVIYKRKHMEIKTKRFLTHLDFRLEVIRSLIGINKLSSINRKNVIKAEAAFPTKDSGCMIVRMEDPRECKICNVSRSDVTEKITFTEYMCKTCELSVCPHRCYDIHHRQKETGAMKI